MLRLDGLSVGRTVLAGVIAAVALGVSAAQAAGPVYFCNTAGNGNRTLYGGSDDCQITPRFITNVHEDSITGTYSTNRGCAAPLNTSGSSQWGVDCSASSTGSAAIDINGQSGATAYPRLKAYSGNSGSITVRGTYYY